MNDRPGVDAGTSSAHPAEGSNIAAKTYHSFQTLLLKPGTLTREYVRGGRLRYLHPLQLFLIVNLLFFLVLSFMPVPGLSTPFRTQLYQQAYSGAVRTAVRDRFLEMDSVAFQQFESRFDRRSETQAKALVILLVPLFALLLWLTRCWHRGESMMQHAVFSTHYVTVLMLIVLVVGALSRLLPAGILPWILLLSCTSYLYPALRHAYDDTPTAALGRAGALGTATLLLVMAYRFILFFTVLYTI